MEEAAATAQIVERMEGTHRMLLHGRVTPNQAGDLEGMDELAAQYRRNPQSLRASSIIDEHAQHPHYQARGERVFCTFAEADDYAERPRRRQAPHAAPNFP